MRVDVRQIQDISLLVRKVRRQKNLSQEKAAALTGVGRRFLSELENGEKESMDLGKVLQVLRRLGIRVQLDVKLDGVN